MRAFVTGASGFVGAALARRLSDEGWIVFNATRGDADPGDPASVTVEGGSFDGFATALDAVKPDVVFHLAGRTHAPRAADFYTANVTPTANLLDAIEASSTKPALLLASSAAEYGPVAPEDMPVAETHPCRPVSDYAISKHTQVLMCRARAERLRILIARIFNPIGAGMPGQLALSSFAAQIRASGASGVLRVGDLDVERDFIAVEEAARLMAGLAATPSAFGGEYNICSGRAYRLRDLVEQMLELAAVKLQIEVDPSRLRRNDMRQFVGDTGSLQALGFSPAAPDFAQLLPQILHDQAIPAAADVLRRT